LAERITLVNASSPLADFATPKMGRYIPLKRRFTQDVHSAISQKTAFFKLFICQQFLCIYEFCKQNINAYSVHPAICTAFVTSLREVLYLRPSSELLPSFTKLIPVSLMHSTREQLVNVTINFLHVHHLHQYTGLKLSIICFMHFIYYLYLVHKVKS
jgi:hypothetical protein